MNSTLSSLEPKSLWGHFDQLRQVPRPSQHEAAAIAHVKRWAASHGYPVEQDAIQNVVVRVPATPGHEKARLVILQGHLDMVAEKDKGFEFDFLKDAIPVRVDGDWVVADHTTLGADNGIGVATALATADDPSVVHGPLELLFTIDEETALTGASSLDGKLLKGRTLLNLDSEEDGTLFVGCAGGCTTDSTFDLERVPLPAGFAAVKVEVGGLKGGHSGLMIHENRGNSIKVLARVLSALLEKQAVLLGTVEAGNKHNAIPREASAIVAVPTGTVAAVKEVAASVVKMELTERGGIDPNLTIAVSEVKGAPGTVTSPTCTRRFLDMLLAIPNGVIVVSRDIPGLTETSSNLAVIRTEGDRVKVTCSSRSSVAPAVRGVLESARCRRAPRGGSHDRVRRLSRLATRHVVGAAPRGEGDPPQAARTGPEGDGNPCRPRVRDHRREARRRGRHALLRPGALGRARPGREGQHPVGRPLLGVPQGTARLPRLSRAPPADLLEESREPAGGLFGWLPI